MLHEKIYAYTYTYILQNTHVTPTHMHIYIYAYLCLPASMYFQELLALRQRLQRIQIVPLHVPLFPLRTFFPLYEFISSLYVCTYVYIYNAFVIWWLCFSFLFKNHLIRKIIWFVSIVKNSKCTHTHTHTYIYNITYMSR